MILDIPLWLYHTGSEYLGRSPIVLVGVTPALQWKHRYFLLGTSLIFERFVLLMNAFHVNWLLRRHQLSSIMYSATAARMVSITCIILTLRFFPLLLICSVYGISCVEVINTRDQDMVVCPIPRLGLPS